MRQTAARLNRGWLIVIGLIVFLAGLAGALISTGAAERLTRLGGFSLPLPAADRHFFGSRTAAALRLDWLIVLIGVAGLLLVVLGVSWLVAQLPRSNAAKPYRLADDARTGLTRCAPDVLGDAVARQIESLHGVQRASAVVRGTASQPELSVKITASDRTDVQQLLGQVQDRVVSNLCASLDTQLRRLAVQLEVVNVSTKSTEITLGADPEPA